MGVSLSFASEPSFSSILNTTRFPDRSLLTRRNLPAGSIVMLRGKSPSQGVVPRDESAPVFGWMEKIARLLCPRLVP